jgi:hypothetical protein
MEHFKARKHSAFSLAGLQAAAALVAERRREHRFPAGKPILLMPYGTLAAKMPNATFRPATLTDCSPHGVGFVTDAPLQPGQRVMVRLHQGELILALYTVRHCAPDAEGQFKIGAEFDHVVCSPIGFGPDEVLAALIHDAPEMP